MLEKLLVLGIICLFVLIPLGEGTLDDGDNEWFYDEETGRWNIEFNEPVIESFIVKYGFVQSFKVGVLFTHDYVFPDHATGFLEASYDHGETWRLLSEFKDRLCDGTNIYTTITSNSLWLRYTIDSTQGWGRWSIWNIDIIGDTRGSPPKSEIYFPGNIGTPCYGNPVTIAVESKDSVGIKSIHCLDNVYSNYYSSNNNTIEFTVTEDGSHQVVFWAVDANGNEEYPQYPPIFCIDLGLPPSVKITSPESGLYIFGEKIISLDITVIIGPVFIEVNASDDKEIYYVNFLLDGKEIGADTEPPYQIYCAYRHSGLVNIEAIAMDNSGNTAEDTVNIHYYNLF